jgi:hypothetical protein
MICLTGQWAAAPNGAAGQPREAGHAVHQPKRRLHPQVRPPRAQRARPNWRAKPAAPFGPSAKRSVRTCDSAESSFAALEGYKDDASYPPAGALFQTDKSIAYSGCAGKPAVDALMRCLGSNRSTDDARSRKTGKSCGTWNESPIDAPRPSVVYSSWAISFSSWPVLRLASSQRPEAKRQVEASAEYGHQ